MNEGKGFLSEAKAFLDRIELKQRNGHGLLEGRVNERGEKVLRVIQREPYRRK